MRAQAIQFVDLGAVDFAGTGDFHVGSNGDLTAPGAFGNLPCGEGFISPLAGKGVLAATSLATVGLVEAQPARLVAARAGPHRRCLRRRRAGAGPA